MISIRTTFDPYAQPRPSVSGRIPTVLTALELVVAPSKMPWEKELGPVVHIRGISTWRNRLDESFYNIPLENMDELARKWLQMRGQLPLDESNGDSA